MFVVFLVAVAVVLIATPRKRKPRIRDPLRSTIDRKLVQTVDVPRIPQLQPGRGPADQIGRYRILARLGAGGMGTVYKAHDPQLDRVVALKLPRFDGTPQDVRRRVQRFQREARVAAQVWHPHVCPIFDVGEHEGQPFVVMAYVEGQSLSQRLADAGRYESISEAVTLIRQILDGLEAVHAHGIVHRDLKPGNILIDPTGKAVLTDFGLARPDTEAEHFTSEGVILGTPSYMAPEQAAGQSDRIGPWTDLYTLGLVLYQMLTGRLPFEGPALTVLSKIVHEEPPRMSTFRADLGGELDAVLVKALAKECGTRFQSARELADALGPWSMSTPALTTSPAIPAGSLSEKPAPSVTIAAVPQSAKWTETSPIYQPPAPTGGRSLGRALGWLAGSLFVALGAAGLAFFVLFLVLFLVLHPLQADPSWFFIALIAMLFCIGLGPVVGLSLWYLAELSHVPEGLWRAARNGWKWCVKHAIGNGVPLNARDDMGETALMQAAAHGRTEIVKLLYLHGADTRLRNPFGQTAWSMARAKGHGDIVALLPPDDSSDTGESGVAPLVWRPSARLRLLLATLVGAAVMAGGWAWRGDYPQRITRERIAFEERLWTVPPMLAVPLVIAFLLGLPLGSAHWFPVLGPGHRLVPHKRTEVVGAHPKAGEPDWR
jgi:serine/threonine protein kinase